MVAIRARLSPCRFGSIDRRRSAVATMQAMVCEAPGRDLAARVRERPEPGPGEVLIEVAACGVCRTDLHLRDGELPQARLPVVPGHEIVGRVLACGPGRGGPRGGAARGRSLARRHLRPLRLLPARPREPVRVGGLHRLHARRRLCRIRGGRCALRVSAARPLRRPPRGAAAVRRADRLPRLRHGPAGAGRWGCTASVRRPT